MAGDQGGRTAGAAISAADMRKSYGDIQAVRGLDLEIPPGEIFGLVGPDGAGKTTAIRILCGVLLPDAGCIYVSGHDVLTDPEGAKASLGYLPQRFSLYGDLTVWENVAFTASLYRQAAAEWQPRARELLRLSDMERFAGRLAANLSGGMRQKLALVCTLIHTPRVLFLDEPTTGVDPVSRRDFWTILYGLPAQGISILISTPYMDEAERCRRVAFMVEGRILACDTPEALKARVGQTVHCLRVSRAQEAQRALAESPLALQAAPFGETLRIVPAPGTGSDDLLGYLRSRGFEVESCRPAAPGLEDVFVSLVEGHGR